MNLKVEFNSYEEVSAFAKQWLGNETKESKPFIAPVPEPMLEKGALEQPPFSQAPRVGTQQPYTPPTQELHASQALQQQPPVLQAQPLPTATIAYTVEQLAIAATQLTDAGRREEIIQLLAKYGARSLMELPKEQYGAFAIDLRDMGAKL